MTIDEAIAHEIEVTAIQRNNDKLNKTLGKNSPYYNTDCIKCAEEHEQIAEWLEDYKHIKQWKSDIIDSFCKYDVSSFEELIANTRNKAIDDFLKKLYKIGEHRDFDWEDMYELAEQLKEGEK